MSKFLPFKVLIALLPVLLLAAPLLPVTAGAQDQIATPLTYAAVTEPTSTEAHIALSFGADPVPAYSVDGNDRPHVEVRLPNTRNVAVDAAGLPLSSLKIGLARSVQIRIDGADIVLVFDSAAPLHIVAMSPGRRQLNLVVTGTVTSASAVASVTPSAAPGLSTGGLSEFADPPPGQDGYALVRLKYADVSEVVGLLSNGATVKSNDSFTPLEPGFGSPGNNNGTTYNPGQNQAQSEDPPLGQPVDSSLSVDRRLNAVWIKGSAEHIARVKAEIEQIDVPVDTVILETQFVELTENGARNIGIDFSNAAGQIAVATFSTGQYLPALNYPNAQTHVGSYNLQAALYAQIQKGQGKIVSKPRIAAQSGSSAKIITGDALPILTAITLSGVNGVSQQVQYVNVGVTLQIAPRVTGDGYVTSHVFAVVSSVSGYSQGYPTISQRHAETSASVKDGDSFVIGGLSQDSALTSNTHVPGLGDIPLLGHAFHLEKSSSSKTDLYIIITPHIVRHGAVEPGH
jgi:general secretion pathway protein D